MNVLEVMKERMSFSFEVFPPKEDKPIEPLLETLDHLYQFNPDFVSCTYGAGGSNAGRNVEICKAIKDSNKSIPVTHFTCIGNTREKIKQELKNYLDIGVDHILALRGDYPKGWEGTRGDFNYANELVEFIKIHYPEFIIAIAGSPEKHVECDTFDKDIAHLRIKQDCGGDYIMTQLCHDMDQFQWWRDKLTKAGIRLPIDVGVMPVLAKDPTIRMALSNGSGIPRDLAEIIGRYGENPEDFKKAGIDYTIKQIYKYMNAGIDGLHIYSLNKWEDVAKIVNQSGIRKMHAK